MQYASDFIGVPYAQDGIITLLGGTSLPSLLLSFCTRLVNWLTPFFATSGTSFVYLREIPMFSTYSTESRSKHY